MNGYIYDRLRSTSSHESTSTPQIGVHWHHYLKSRSDLRVFSNWHPFQILRSMVDLLLSNRRRFQSEDLFVLLSCRMMDVGQVSTSSVLHIISNECKASKVPGINSVRPTHVYKNVHQQPSYLNKFESRIYYNIEWRRRIKNGWAVDASILCLIFDICAAYKDVL